MAIIPTPASLNGELQEIFRRLRNLENAPRGVTRSPSSVSGATADSLGFIDSTGIAQGVVRLSWVAPTVAVDGTPLTPDRYEVYGRQTVDSLGYPVTDPQWSLITTVDHPTTSAQAGPFSSQSTWEFRVRAVSKKGQRSDFVYLTIVIALDGTVPPVPSTPLVASSLRTLSMTWDGKDSTGLLMPAAFAFVEVHLSLTSGFTPDATTLVDTLTGPGTIPRVQLALGQVVYVKFRAKSRTGVLSAATPQATITILGITGPDIEANSITSNEVNTGLLTAAMVRGDVMTSSLGTGARFRLSAADGLKLYNSSNALTVWFDAATGNGLMTGIFRTKASGLRVEINDALNPNYAGIALFDGSSNSSVASILAANSVSGSPGLLLLNSGRVSSGSMYSTVSLFPGGEWAIGSYQPAIGTEVRGLSSGQISVTAPGSINLTTTSTGNIQLNTAASTGSIYLDSGTGNIWLKGARLYLSSPTTTTASYLESTATALTLESSVGAVDLKIQSAGSMIFDFGRSGAAETCRVRLNTVDKFIINSTAIYSTGRHIFRFSGDATQFIESTSTTNLRVRASVDLVLEASSGVVNMPSTVGTAATSSSANAFFGSTGNLVKSSVSSRRYKDNIEDLHYTREEFMRLRPVRFNSALPMDENRAMVGFIAEDVQDIGWTELVTLDDFSLRPERLSYEWLTAPLVQQVQELIREVAELKERLN